MNGSMLIGSILGVFLLLSVLVESLVLVAFQVGRYKRVLLHTTFVNVASLLVVYLAWPLISRMDLDEDKVFPLLPVLLGIVILIEAMLLILLNRKASRLRLIVAAVAMNVISVALPYFLLLLL